MGGVIILDRMPGITYGRPDLRGAPLSSCLTKLRRSEWKMLGLYLNAAEYDNVCNRYWLLTRQARSKPHRLEDSDDINERTKMNVAMKVPINSIMCHACSIYPAIHNEIKRPAFY